MDSLRRQAQRRLSLSPSRRLPRTIDPIKPLYDQSRRRIWRWVRVRCTQPPAEGSKEVVVLERYENQFSIPNGGVLYMPNKRPAYNGSHWLRRSEGDGNNRKPTQAAQQTAREGRTDKSRAESRRREEGEIVRELVLCIGRRSHSAGRSGLALSRSAMDPDTRWPATPPLGEPPKLPPGCDRSRRFFAARVARVLSRFRN